ncbi:MAG: hypothetical protein K6G08_07595 [Prevotella sp.]|nr:hypothetical protein [Prevotella sp.]
MATQQLTLAAAEEVKKILLSTKTFSVFQISSFIRGFSSVVSMMGLGRMMALQDYSGQS